MFKPLSYLRRCALCSSLFGGDFGICPSCDQLLLKTSLSETLMPQQFSFDVHRLFISTDRDSLIRDLIVRLKGSDQSLLWQYFANLYLLKRLQSQKDLPDSAIIISAPSSTGRGHAQLFADKMSALTDWPHLNLLKSDSKLKAQKYMSRNERLSKSIFAEARALNITDPIIFIDDVFVTGGTALAAYKALGQKDFEVWCLAHQLLLH